MNNTGSFPFSPTPKKRVLTEAFPFLAHGGGTCGFSRHGQLGVVCLVCFLFHSFQMTLFFLARWWFCSYLFGIFISYCHEHIFRLGCYKPPTADRRFGPIRVWCFFSVKPHVLSASNLKLPILQKETWKKTQGTIHERDGNGSENATNNWNFVNPIIYVEDLRGCCSMLWICLSLFFKTWSLSFYFHFFRNDPKTKNYAPSQPPPSKKPATKPALPCFHGYRQAESNWVKDG